MLIDFGAYTQERIFVPAGRTASCATDPGPCESHVWMAGWVKSSSARRAGH